MSSSCSASRERPRYDLDRTPGRSTARRPAPDHEPAAARPPIHARRNARLRRRAAARRPARDHDAPADSPKSAAARRLGVSLAPSGADAEAAAPAKRALGERHCQTAVGASCADRTRPCAAAAASRRSRRAPGQIERGGCPCIEPAPQPSGLRCRRAPRASRRAARLRRPPSLKCEPRGVATRLDQAHHRDVGVG